MKIPFLTLLLLMCVSVTCQSPHTEHISSQKKESRHLSPPTERQVGGPCECCEAMFEGMPDNLDWQSHIAKADEPGEPLEISGTIYKNDGTTPAHDVILYVYHTDHMGLYSSGSKTSKCAARHGHLRGWMKTGANGHYYFKTIRPASYPNTNFAQHIHPQIKEPGMQVYWIDEYVFDDDPKLTPTELASHQIRGGSGVIKLSKNAAGAWVGHRDIILGKNVPGY